MKFEIGNKVYCTHHEATGTITDIKPDETYPIYVTFKNNTTDTYTKQGKLLKIWKRLSKNSRKGNI